MTELDPRPGPKTRSQDQVPRPGPKTRSPDCLNDRVNVGARIELGAVSQLHGVCARIELGARSQLHEMGARREPVVSWQPTS